MEHWLKWVKRCSTHFSDLRILAILLQWILRTCADHEFIGYILA